MQISCIYMRYRLSQETAASACAEAAEAADAASFAAARGQRVPVVDSDRAEAVATMNIVTVQ
ncbi:MAG: hypothetical protein AMXMBFR52_17070 [Burkholderiales bacterium]|jgi:hypothetical protein